MPRTPKRLAGPALVASGAAATKYTVPSTTKAIVRHIHIENGSASAATITLSIGTDAAGTRILDAVSVPATDFIDHYCYYVLEAAEIMQAFAGTNNVLTLTINGDEATLG